MQKNFFLLLISISILGCSTNESTIINSDYAEYITGQSIDTGIDFMPEEIYTLNEAQEPILKLKLKTSEIYPCINYGLATTQFIKESELIVRFDEIITSEICLTALGPATTHIDLPEQITQLTFINGRKIDTYSIEINQEKISISLIESSFTSSLHNETFRIPENSFAYLCGTTTETTGIYNDFASILEENPNFTEFEFEGEGRIPYPETIDGHWVNHPSKFYKYTDDNAFNNLSTTLNEFSSEHIEENSGVNIYIYGWNNVKFSSREVN